MHSLIYEVRFLGATCKRYPVAYGNVLIANNIRKFAVVAYVIFTHYYAVFQNGALAHLYSAEEHAVFYRSLYQTAVMDERIADLCGFGKLCGSRVVDFRIDIPACEQLGADFLSSKSMFALK